MALFTSTQNGNWTDSATWGGAGVPGDGDTVTIGYIITVDQNTIIGTSPSDTTTKVIEVTGTGQLIIATDTSLTVRGNSLYNVGSSGNPANGLILNPGSSFLCDPSQATTSSTSYKIEFGQYSTWQANGAVSNKCIFGTIAGYGFAELATTYWDYGACSAPAVYCDFQNISSFKQRSAGSIRALEINIQNCTFSNVSNISIGNTVLDGRLIFNNNTIDENAGTVIFYGENNQTELCETKDNVILSSAIYNPPANYIITGNYFGDSVNTNAVSAIGSLPLLFSNNFILSKTGAKNVECDIIDSIWLDDSNYNNPSVINMPGDTKDSIFTGCIIDSSGTASQGDFIFPQSTGGYKNTIAHSIFLPNSKGQSPGKFVSDAFINADTLCDVLNCTYVTFGAVGTEPETAIGIGESAAAYAGYMPNLKNNIAWTYPGVSPGGWKALRQQSNVQDIITDADYNWGWGLSEGSEGDGYNTWAAYRDLPMFSYTPDVNGGSGDPEFVDYTRNVATYDIAGLGNSADTAWLTGQSYTVGDMVSAQDSGYYFDTIINYRCINPHTSATGDSTDGKPGLAANWRTNWEFTTLYRLREDISRITNLLTWIRGGFAPTNQSLKGSGESGVDIGAVAVAIADNILYLKTSLTGGVLVELNYNVLAAGKISAWDGSKFPETSTVSIGVRSVRGLVDTNNDLSVKLETVGMQISVNTIREVSPATFNIPFTAYIPHDLTTDLALLRTQEGDEIPLYVEATTGLIKGVDDAANVCVSATAVTAGSEVSGWWSGNGPAGEMWITLNGVKGTVATFSGSLATIGNRIFGADTGEYQTLEALGFLNELPYARVVKDGKLVIKDGKQVIKYL